MRYYIILIFILILTSFAAHAAPELKGTPDELSNYLSAIPEEVTLTGEAKLEMQANKGIVTIGIKTEAPQLQKSLQENQELRNEITKKLISSGISQDNIKGTKFSSTPEYGFFGKKPNNYVVDNSLKISVENEKELQEVAGIVDNYKNVFYQGLELKKEKKEEVKKQLLNMALANAKARQKVYENELNIILEPISFEENISVDMPVMQEMFSRKSKLAYESIVSSSSYEKNLDLGEHVYYGSVNVRYKVRKKTK